MRPASCLARTGLIALPCCLFLLVACGDDAGPKGPAVRELPELYAASLCPEVEACLDSRSLQQVFGEGGCMERLTAQGEDSDLPAIQSAIDDGRVDYDATQVEPCLAELEDIGCDFATARSLSRGVCEKIFTGTVAKGGDCDVDEECKGIAFCQKSDTCPGTCSELLGPGDACKADDQCEDGLSCAKDGTCAAPAGEDEPCGGSLATECSAGLACIGADEMTGKAGSCTKADEVFVGDEGDACDFESGMLCKSPLSCIVESVDPATSAVSLICAKGVSAGEPCKFGAPSQCPIEQRCDADIAVGDIEGTCVPLPGAGEVCVMTSSSPACAPGLHCDLDERCHTLARLGQACESDAGCASGRCAWPDGEDGKPDLSMQGRCERPEVCAL